MIDHNNLVIEGRSKSFILATVDTDIGSDAVTIADFTPPILKHRSIECHTTPNDRNQSTTWPKSEEGLFDVSGPKRGPMSPHSASGCRKGGIHHDGVERQPVWKEVVEPLRIKRGRLKSQLFK